jgi:predicted nucleic acid-binding protein
MDSSGYFTLTHARDAFHAEAVSVFGQLTAERYRFFTTNFILAELHALLQSRVNRQVALAVLTQIDNSRMTTIVRARQQDEQRAHDILRRYDDKDFSLTDAVSFAVMERLGISIAFTFDQHFGQYGWQLAPPSPFP